MADYDAELESVLATSEAETFEDVSTGDNRYILMLDDDVSVQINGKAVDKLSLNLGEVMIDESESEMRTFRIPRYRDGVDLSTKTIRFYYKRSDDFVSFSPAKNVKRTNDDLEFSWILDGTVTAVTGTVDVDIVFTGVSEKGKPYLLRLVGFNIEILDGIDISATIPSTNNSLWIIDVDNRLDTLENKQNPGITKINEDDISSVLSQIDSMVEVSNDGTWSYKGTVNIENEVTVNTCSIIGIYRVYLQSGAVKNYKFISGDCEIEVSVDASGNISLVSCDRITALASDVTQLSEDLDNQEEKLDIFTALGLSTDADGYIVQTIGEEE